MKTRLKLGLFVITALLLMQSCLDKVEFPDTPAILFVELHQTDFIKYPDSSLYFGALKFSFTDGDGDLGLEDHQTEKPYDFNLFLSIFKKVNGQYELLPSHDTIIGDNYRIPYLTPNGQNKSLEGNITIDILDIGLKKGDTVKIDFFMKDRALNESNVETTSDIGLIY